MDPLPRRADPGPRCRRGAPDPRAGRRLACRGARSDGDAHDPLHGRGRGRGDRRRDRRRCRELRRGVGRDAGGGADPMSQGRVNPIFARARGRDPREASAWSPREILVNDLHALVGRAYPRVRAMAREKSWLFFEILLPFLATSAFVLVYRALHAPEAYVGFAVIGGAMTAFWLNVVWMMAAQLWWEKSQGNLELYFAAPMDLMAVA